MKNLFRVGIVFILALGLISLALGQEKAKQEQPVVVSKSTSEQSSGVGKSEEAKGRQVSEKPDIWRMGGLVTTVDVNTETLSIHQETLHHDRVMKLKVSEKAAKELSNLKPGDLVNVWVTGKTVTALNRVG